MCEEIEAPSARGIRQSGSVLEIGEIAIPGKDLVG